MDKKRMIIRNGRAIKMKYGVIDLNQWYDESVVALEAEWGSKYEIKTLLTDGANLRRMVITIKLFPTTWSIAIEKGC